MGIEKDYSCIWLDSYKWDMDIIFARLDSINLFWFINLKYLVILG